MSFIELLKEPFFYICSLIVALMLSISANLLTPRVEKIWSSISKRRRQKQININLEKLDKVAYFQKHSDDRTETILNVIHNNILAIFLMVFSFGLFLFATALKGIAFLIISTMSALLFIFSLKIVDRGIDEIIFVRLAFKRKKACREFNENRGGNVSAEEFKLFLEYWDKNNLGPLE